MNNHKTQLIKQAISNIDISKISTYLQEYPKSKTLRQIAGYIERVQQTDNEQEIFKMGVRTAYNLDSICDRNKAGYV
jgi:hypothetical protein